MNTKEVMHWVEAHPGESILIGGGVVIALLWLFGAFSKSAPAADTSGQSLAAAYYAAEAQQAVVGGQIQMANISATASTAQALIGANAAQAINATNATAATTLNQQNASAATTINSQNVGAATTINAQNVAGAENIAGQQFGFLTLANNNQLLATEHNNNTALAALQSNNATAQAINLTNAQASITNTALHTIVPQELSYVHQGNFGLPLVGSFTVNTGGTPDVNQMLSLGLTPEEAHTFVQDYYGQPHSPPAYPFGSAPDTIAMSGGAGGF